MTLARTLRLALALLVAASTARAAVDPTALAAARALLEAHRPAEAQQAFERLAAADPGHAEVNLHLGELALRRDDPERAIVHFERAVAADPSVARHHGGLGEALGRAAQKASIFRQFGLARRCLAAYLRAVELDPAHVPYRQCLFEYYRQAPSLIGGGLDKALSQADAIKKLDATRGRIALASLHLDRKKYDLALAEFDDALRADPDDYLALHQVGRIAALSGRHLERGEAALRRCLALTPPPAPDVPGHATIHWQLGALLEKKPDPSGARAAYEAALRLDPSLAAATEALRRLPPVKP